MALVIRHPFHEWPLTRRDSARHFIDKCGICSLEVRGAAYECADCYSYLLHEACALVEIPLQIADHPIHPEHPLAFENGKYKCGICDISHEASIVMATPTLLEEEGIIQPLYHDHPLTAFSLKLPNWISCVACREPIPGPAYGCQTCDYFLHESCARLPEEILQHPSHPQHPLTLSTPHDTSCLLCHSKRQTSYPAYHCEECGDDIMIHMACTAFLLSLQERDKEDRVAINHFSHEHQLLSGQVENSPATLLCAACNLQISGEAYYCLECGFFLHKLCADELPHDMVHHLHPEHPLVLCPEPMYDTWCFTCDCCGSQYCEGMLFHCASCKFSLHPKCALETCSAARDGLATKIQFFGHDHPLLLSWSDRSRCRVCHQAIVGQTYSCTGCEYRLHISCVEPPMQLEHPLHSHPLHLVTERRICSDCSSVFKGLSFNCPECDFDLCFICALERSTLKHQLHEHTLGYLESIPDEDNVLCSFCGKVDSIDMYCCRRCNFNLHRDCLPLPPTIQHECHPYHPLVLFDEFVDGLPEYQYCDFCEELRNPEHGVYRCAREECWYTAHIGCVLPQATQHEKLYLDKLSDEITSLEGTIEEKENDLVALKQKLEELKGARRKILSKHDEEE